MKSLSIFKHFKIVLCTVFMLCMFHSDDVCAADMECYIGYYGNEPCTVPYIGNFYGVDIYSDSLEKVNLVIPWIEYISRNHTLDCQLVICDDAEFSLNQLIPIDEDTGLLQFSTNWHAGALKGLNGEYNSRYQRSIVSANLSDEKFQLTVLHELGHYFDDQYDVSSQMSQDMVDFVEQLSVEHGTSGVAGTGGFNNSEAFAEFFMFQTTGVLG